MVQAIDEAHAVDIVQALQPGTACCGAAAQSTITLAVEPQSIADWGQQQGLLPR